MMGEQEKTEKATRKRRRDNVMDIIGDEIYGACRSSLDGPSILILKKDVRKIAKRIMRRTAIGPI